MSARSRTNAAVKVLGLFALFLFLVVPATVSGTTGSRPSAPSSVHAVAGKASATVSWKKPAATGGAPITAYIATSHPSNRTCRTGATTCTVQGLTIGRAYTFTVVAISEVGQGPGSTRSNQVIPWLSTRIVTSFQVAEYSGTGNGSEPRFTIPESATKWEVKYNFSCSNVQTTCSFGTDIQGYGKTLTTADVGASQLGSAGGVESGVSIYNDTGAFSINVGTVGFWYLNVFALGRWVVPVYTTTTTTTTVPPTTTTTTGIVTVLLAPTSGSGTAKIPQFTVPPSANNWKVGWTYDCSNHGMSGNFITDITGYGNAAGIYNPGEDQLGMGGSGIDTYDNTGTFSIQVISECNWSIGVTFEN